MELLGVPDNTERDRHPHPNQSARRCVAGRRAPRPGYPSLHTGVVAVHPTNHKTVFEREICCWSAGVITAETLIYRFIDFWPSHAPRSLSKQTSHYLCLSSFTLESCFCTNPKSEFVNSRRTPQPVVDKIGLPTRSRPRGGRVGGHLEEPIFVIVEFGQQTGSSVSVDDTRYRTRTSRVSAYRKRRARKFCSTA